LQKQLLRGHPLFLISLIRPKAGFEHHIQISKQT
ncbi:unnamed protein product, partial [marine sediment metagenome]